MSKARNRSESPKTIREEIVVPTSVLEFGKSRHEKNVCRKRSRHGFN